MTKGEQARLTAWRLRVLQQAADEQNVARVCRRFGISRKSFYKWKRRQAEHGDAGLADRPRTPLRSPRATAGDVVSKILYLRQHYHFGPGRIAAYLQRFHRITIAGSSVHRILIRHRLNRLPANQKHRPHGKRWRRYEKPQPGHRLQLDVKFLERLPGMTSCGGYPFRVHVVQTDNGAEFQSQFHCEPDIRKQSARKLFSLDGFSAGLQAIEIVIEQAVARSLDITRGACNLIARRDSVLR